MSALVNYEWPGNVRELENAIERALVMGSSDAVLLEDLPESLLEQESPAEMHEGKYHASVKELKKQLIADAVEQTRGNYVEAAGILGVHANYTAPADPQPRIEGHAAGHVAGTEARIFGLASGPEAYAEKRRESQP